MHVGLISVAWLIYKLIVGDISVIGHFVRMELIGELRTYNLYTMLYVSVCAKCTYI